MPDQTERPTPDTALAELMAGNARYVQGDWDMARFSVDRAAHVQTQTPLAAILSCADARVAAELIFLRGPGDLFMVRVAGKCRSCWCWDIRIAGRCLPQSRWWTNALISRAGFPI